MTKANSAWSSLEITFLVSNFYELSTAEIADNLKRSMGSVRVQACRLGLSARYGPERASSQKKLEKERLSFLKDTCMVTPSSKVGEYWSMHTKI